MTNETWRALTAAPDYEVSSLGRLRRCTPGKNTYPGRVLMPTVNRKGYRNFRAHGAAGGALISLRRAVCEAFHGPPPFPDAEAAHDNGDPADDRADNLSWKTAQENIDDRERHGRTKRGVQMPQSVLCDDDVRAIRSSPLPGVVLADLYGVTGANISAVRHRRTWKHVA